MKSKLLLLILLTFTGSSLHAQVSITIDPNVKLQTIEGWGHGGGIFFNLNYGVDPLIRDSMNFQYLNYITHDLGLTGSRTWEVGPRIDGTGMDNGDCDSIDWSKFQARNIDSAIARYTVYFKDLVEAQGYHTSFYSSPTYSTAATAFKPWVFNHPGERAQQIWANALWWKNFGIDINYDVIFNEPSGSETPQLIAEDIKALGPRLKNLGLATKTQYAEAVAPQTDWNYITPVQNDPDLWQYIGRLSYHNYGTADPFRAQIRDFGKTMGIPTAQTEMGNPTIDDLFNDLIFGGVTYWEIAFSGSSTLVPNAGNTGFTPSSTYFRMRQLMHYVRPGDIRIGAASSDSIFRVLAFAKNGKVTTVIVNGAAGQAITLSGLPPGNYGLSQSSPGTTSFQELGIHTAGADGKISFNAGGSGMATTLYPYSGANNPPTIMSWGVSPGYVVSPVTTAILSCKASDPELDKLTYIWSVASQPPGADVMLATSNAASSAVSGLTAAGTYVFMIQVSDGVNTSSKKVYLIVYASNPPPVLGPSGFRFAAPYGLVFAALGDTTHANIELPTSSATLQVQVGDLANSNFSGRGKWTLVSQPPGANAKLDSTIYIYISIRAQVSNMIVPGDYVFQCNVTSPGHPDLTTRIFCTVHPASTGPLINSISVIPPSLTLPKSTTLLSAATSDPQGQLLRHWWVVKSAPAGAKPVFEHQGLANSNVSGLTVAGNYSFTLRAFDDLHMVTKDITVIVNKASGVIPKSDDVGLEIYPNPVSEELNVRLRDDNDKISRLVISNALGQVVVEQIVKDNDEKIILPVGSLPVGIYFLTVQTKDGMTTRKIVKQ